MRNKYFVILSLILLLFCIAAYPILIDRVAIPDRVIDRSYRQFLLKASKPIKNKIIISSGSNSLFSIDSRLMEKRLGRFVLISADNGDYPLEHRIYNFSNYVSTGDIILLPLEFGYYVEGKKLSDYYMMYTFDKKGSLSFYYRDLPFYNKLDFIYKHVPFILALRKILSLNSLWQFNNELLQNELVSIHSTHKYLNAGSRGNALSTDPKGLIINVPDKTCDEYLFVNNEMDDNFKVSEQFRDNLALLQKMTRETGAQVFFTWPTVTTKEDDECYTTAGVKDNIDKYAQKIAAEVTRHGFKFIGDMNDSRFDGSCLHYHFYHIQAACAVERTNRLIDLLEANGITPITNYSTEESQKILNNYLTKIELPLLDKLSPLPINVPIEITEAKKNLLISSGWSHRDNDGVWSTGNTSTIIIPKLDARVNSIRLKGTYFNGVEKTGIWINDRFAGKYVLQDQVINVADKLNNGSYNRIVLEHSNPIAPVEVGLNTDIRKLKYKLQSIEFIN